MSKWNILIKAAINLSEVSHMYISLIFDQTLGHIVLYKNKALW